MDEVTSKYQFLVRKNGFRVEGSNRVPVDVSLRETGFRVDVLGSRQLTLFEDIADDGSLILESTRPPETNLVQYQRLVDLVAEGLDVPMAASPKSKAERPDSTMGDRSNRPAVHWAVAFSSNGGGWLSKLTEQSGVCKRPSLLLDVARPRCCTNRSSTKTSTLPRDSSNTGPPPRWFQLQRISAFASNSRNQHPTQISTNRRFRTMTNSVASRPRSLSDLLNWGISVLRLGRRWRS